MTKASYKKGGKKQVYPFVNFQSKTFTMKVKLILNLESSWAGSIGILFPFETLIQKQFNVGFTG